MSSSLHRLATLEGAPGDDLVAEVASRGAEVVGSMLDLLGSRASLSTPWPLVGAARVLARMRAEAAIGGLVDLLEECADPENVLSDEVAIALEEMGGAAVPALLSLCRRTSRLAARDQAEEILLRVAAEYEDDSGWRGRLRSYLEGRFAAGLHPGVRAVYAGYLGDLGDPEALPVLLRGVENPHLSPEEYQAIHEAVERLDGHCPELYFDREGRAYDVDDEDVPHCRGCGQPMRIEPESGDLVHADGSPPGH